MKKQKEAPIIDDTGPLHQPGMSLEAREAQLIALAYDEVEYRIKNHEATSQELVHFLRMGSTKEKRDAEMDHIEMNRKKAQTEALESAKRMEELYEKAIGAVQSYRSPVAGGPVIVEEDI